MKKTFYVILPALLIAGFWIGFGMKSSEPLASPVSGERLIDALLVDPEISRILKSKSTERNIDSFILVYFTSLCESCPETKLLSEIKKLSRNSALNILILLHYSHSHNDIDNIINNLGLEFDYVVIDEKLSSYVTNYAISLEIPVNGFVMQIDSSGDLSPSDVGSLFGYLSNF